jgi:hypothetical protein
MDPSFESNGEPLFSKTGENIDNGGA